MLVDSATLLLIDGAALLLVDRPAVLLRGPGPVVVGGCSGGLHCWLALAIVPLGRPLQPDQSLESLAAGQGSGEGLHAQAGSQDDLNKIEERERMIISNFQELERETRDGRTTTAVRMLSKSY